MLVKMLCEFGTAVLAGLENGSAHGRVGRPYRLQRQGPRKASARVWPIATICGKTSRPGVGVASRSQLAKHQNPLAMRIVAENRNQREFVCFAR